MPGAEDTMMNSIETPAFVVKEQFGFIWQRFMELYSALLLGIQIPLHFHTLVQEKQTSSRTIQEETAIP